VRLAHDLLSFDHFAIRLLDQETGKLELVMSRGLPAAATGITLYAKEDGNGISGHVAATGESYICRDASRDPRYVTGMDRAGSSLTVPLRLFHRVIGVFNVESERPDAFTESDRQFAEIFAYYLAMAIHILNLLLVERVTTSETATGNVQGELSEPLNDLAIEAEWLKEQVAANPEFAKHAERILKDVEAIRRRIRDVARGPRTLLGVDEAVAHKEIDPALQGRRILVADNEPTIRETVRDVLRLRGCTVVDCDSGEAAIKLLDQWRITHDATEAFDLVISDINLGDKTGYEVFASAKAAKAEIPVILMTGFGYDPHHSIVRASQEGLQCVLFKPFRVEKLVEEVRGAVGRK
jgi:CheY-like chemotaxis protein